MKYIFIFIIALSYEVNQIQSAIENVKFCLINEWELAKCEAFKSAVDYNTNVTKTHNIDCVLGRGVFDCMEKIRKREADIITLDVGLAYYAVQNFALRVIAVESYNDEIEPARMNLKYTSNAVIVKGTVKHPKDLKGAAACFAGAGTAEGWSYPLARMIKQRWMRVENCNSEVKTANAFFTSGSCAPGSAEPTFNTLGDNGNLACSRCSSQSDSRRYCTAMDPYAGSAGAIQCLLKSAKTNTSVAFVRGDVLARLSDNETQSLELLCPEAQPDGSFTAPLTKIAACNWGQPQSRMIMTRLTSDTTASLSGFFAMAVTQYGPNATLSPLNNFTLFGSDPSAYTISPELKLILGQSGDSIPPQPPVDLIFSDSTRNIYFPKDSVTLDFFGFIDSKFREVTATLRNCPVAGIKWCVVGIDEMEKCNNMKLALDSQMIRPQFSCVQGGTTMECMRLVSDGYADLITLDAAEVYIGGKFLNLVPLAIEFYGDETSYYAVAVVKRADKGILISNWRYRRTCHGGAGKAVGWVKPINVALETVQMRVRDNQVTYGFSELVGRACVPGILSDGFAGGYTATGGRSSAVNLCELCAAGGQDRCQPDTREQYYGDAGAFRCMIETGDIAFTRHTIVHDNTDGRNPVHWARNRRSDDYELLCSDGSRVDTYSWRRCNLGRIPGNMVVTGGFKTTVQRDAMWKMLRYSQEYFSSDSNNVFSMFASPFGRNDLMFSDSAVSLRYIPAENQTYEKMLSRSFKREVENLELIGAMKWSGLFNPNSATINLLTRHLFIISGFVAFLTYFLG